MEKEKNWNAILMAALLVSGTAIGAGMLAIPLVTGIAGFLPAMVINFLCWLFMLATGLLFLEAVLWMDPGANLLPTAERFLGKWGRILGGVTFLFLYYCLLVSYIAGGAPLLEQGLQLTSLGISLGIFKYPLFAALLGAIIFSGPFFVNRINWILMWGLILAYLFLLGLGADQVKLENLTHTNWSAMWFSAPVLFAAYGFHNIVPSIAMHLKRNGPALRWAILIGTLIPFVVYTFWQWLMIGCQSLEALQTAAAIQVPASVLLQQVVGHPWIGLLGAYFAFFAIVTSLLGVALSMVDFYADGLLVKRSGWSRFYLTMMVFIPPTIFACIKPEIFVTALGVAGGFGESLINGLFPVLMVWMGRYKLGLKSDWSLPGGKTMLRLLVVVTLLIILLEFVELLS
jgi:tyrosine-specific transport protein